jgi:hypothetical protein
MHHKFAKDGLVVMTVDIDARELNKQDTVLKFLGKQGATFPNFILNDTKENVKEWKFKWDVELDMKLIVDRAGKKVPIPNDLKEDEFDGFLKKVLDQQ